jgi:GTP-binding protein
MKFIDEARIFLRSGHGGKGCVCFLREKFMPRGGPNGGNGGKGGDVIFRANSQLDTLLDFRYQKEYLAPDGNNGEPHDKSGADGADLIVPVPIGTRILEKSGKLIADLTEHGQDFVVAKGGRGGKGNAHFKSATRQAPTYAQPGEDGEDLWAFLELQLIADVGLLGFPNAGKSTLVRAISSATPKVADYPFTTLVPNLGVIKHHERRFVMADLPGLIEGAHEGKGLGDRFLRHLSRNRVLLYVLATDGELAPPEAYDALRYEVGKHQAELLSRPFVIALSKCDIAPTGTELGDAVEAWTEALKTKVQEETGENFMGLVHISGITRLGLPALLKLLHDALVSSGRWSTSTRDDSPNQEKAQEFNPLTFGNRDSD